jgi:hypothetical protein
MTTRRLPARGFLAMALMLGGLVAPLAAADPWTVPYLQSIKPEWDKLTNGVISVEGRFSSYSKLQLRLARCDVTFHLSEEQARQISGTKVLALTGTFRKERDANRYLVDVASLRVLTAEIETFQVKERALRNPTPDDWYELARWARERGDFYEDAALQLAGRTCQVRGVALEAKKLPKEDYEGRLKLAEKIRDWKLPATVPDELHHEALREWLHQATTPSAARQTLEALLQRLPSIWPEALQPLPNWPTELAKAYALDPVATYVAGDPLERRQLRRVFGAQVQQQQILRELPDEATQGLAIADRLAKAIPEQPALAERYRERELTQRYESIGKGSRAEALALAELFRQRKQANLARDTLRRWLTARTRPPLPNDAPALIALADDARQWLQDEPLTVELLTAAHRIEPGSEAIATRFNELGYEWRTGRWFKKGPTTAPPPKVPQPANQPISVGMTAADLLDQVGRPTTRSALVTSAGQEEWWSYGSSGSSRLIVHLRSVRNGPGLRVVRFATK